mgnify:CR=1 FL=1
MDDIKEARIFLGPPPCLGVKSRAMSLEETLNKVKTILERHEYSVNKIKWDTFGFTLKYVEYMNAKNNELERIQKSLPPGLKDTVLEPDQDHWCVRQLEDYIEIGYTKCISTSYIISTVYDVRVGKFHLERQDPITVACHYNRPRAETFD